MNIAAIEGAVRTRTNFDNFSEKERSQIMRTLAIANQKGGSGKTTTSVNLAAALGEQNRRVLMVDLDPQHSATSWFGINDAGKGVLGIFMDGGNLLDYVQENAEELIISMKIITSGTITKM